MEKNNSINLWRIIFTYLIVVFHFDTTFPWMREAGLVPGWYLAVEFFFLVSGYLIYAKSDEYIKRYDRAFRFTLHRYARIWPKYIAAFCLTFLAIHILGKSSLSVPDDLWNSRYELVLLQGLIARGWDWINPTLWYLSVMLVSGFIMFLGLRYLRSIFIKIIAPASIVLCLAAIMVKSGNLDAAVMMPGEYVNYPLFRGIAEMFMGMYACMLTEKPAHSGYIKAWHTLGLLFMASGIVMAAFYGHSYMDLLILLLFFFGVAWGFLPVDGTLYGSRLIRFWSDITLEIYLLHELFRTHIFPYFFRQDAPIGQKLLYMLLYMTAVTAAAGLMHLIFEFTERFFKFNGE